MDIKEITLKHLLYNKYLEKQYYGLAKGNALVVVNKGINSDSCIEFNDEKTVNEMNDLHKNDKYYIPIRFKIKMYGLVFYVKYTEDICSSDLNPF